MFIIKLSLLTCSFPPRILPNVTRNPIHHQFSLIISVLADALSSHRAPQWKQLRLFRQSFCPQYCGPEHFLEQLRLRLRFFKTRSQIQILVYNYNLFLKSKALQTWEIRYEPEPEPTQMFWALGSSMTQRHCFNNVSQKCAQLIFIFILLP